MASGLLLGLLVGGPGLFPTYFASARATCTPPTAFVSSALRLVKGYKLPPAALEEKVTFTIWPETSHVGKMQDGVKCFLAVRSQLSLVHFTMVVFGAALWSIVPP